MAQDKKKQAIPLVLPNNYEWDETTWQCSIKPGEKSEKLETQQQALAQLSEIKGPVCVVAIAGPYRQGKSYALSKAFSNDQEQVFPLGHEMVAETIGLWLWVVPEKVETKAGQEFTVVLIDSEGVDSPKGFKDHANFTLAVLLSNILIYNSVGVAMYSDLERLDFIEKLTERVELYSSNETDAVRKDKKDFSGIFPHFIWLLRDSLLKLPKDCENVKEYFTKTIFRDYTSTEGSKMAAESILNLFSNFDAFRLPAPSTDPEIMCNVIERNDELNPVFLKEMESFKVFLREKLCPKTSINNAEYVTGEALAKLTTHYVDALNTPGMIPNVQAAWDTFTQMKCTEAVAGAVEIYEHEAKTLAEKVMPCEADDLWSIHGEIMDKCLERFHEETLALSMKTTDEYKKDIEGRTTEIFSGLLQTNKKKTQDDCTKLADDLEKEELEPVLKKLLGPSGHQMDFNDLREAYNLFERKYEERARGDKEARKDVLIERQSRLNDEMTHNFDILVNLKNYDALLIKEKQEKALLQQLEERAREEKKYLEEEAKRRQREIDNLIIRQEKESKRLEEVFAKQSKDQREQLQNFVQSHFDELRKERQDAIAGQQTVEDSIKSMKQTIDKKEEDLKRLMQKMDEREQQAQKDKSDLKKEYEERSRKDREAMNEMMKMMTEKLKDSQEKIKEDIKTTVENNNRVMDMQRQSQMKADAEDKLKNASLLKRFRYLFGGNPATILK